VVVPDHVLFEGGAGETIRRKVLQRDKVSLELSWIPDESLEDSASLPDPDEIAAEIVEDLQAALEQFAAIANELKG
jgi:type I restriction enzyme M protein